MTIILPEVRHIENNNNIAHIATCASTCYHSNPASPSRMVERLIRDGHLSMLRHASYYYKIPVDAISDYAYCLFMSDSYCSIINDGEYYFLVINGQWRHENKELIDTYDIYRYASSRDEFLLHPKARYIVRLTFSITTQVAITRELNRTSPNNIAERSTRFIDYIKKLGIRFSMPHWWKGLNIYRHVLANAMLKVAEWLYCIARSPRGLNLPAEDARYFLILGTESEAVYTYTILEWLHIIDLRVKGTTGKPHPDARIAVEPIRYYIHSLLSHLNDA